MPNTTVPKQDDKGLKSPDPISGRAQKEIESVGEPTELTQIRELSHEADVVAEKEVQEALGEEARLAQAEPKIGPDLEDHGVTSPEKDASEAIKKGNVELPMTEEEYKNAQKAKVEGRRDDKDNVLGVASVIALAMWVGRILKKLHGHATRIVFRKGGGD